MRTKARYILSLLAVAGLMAGCAGPEQKLGRGMNNMVELVRLGEFRRAMEQGAIFDTPGHGGITTGVITGIDRSLARTGAGLYEVITFPIPNHRYNDYGPVFHPADPVYPDSYKPDWIAESTLQPDTSLGFAGGDIAPYIPGSRFRIFDN